ncbi:MAG: hypothetical protein LBS36_04450 [Oscillospiraceae bacterium]|jgi:hypothetical protein|nr:hypothetical protein [Oscillospiraceae bacterium]
MSKTWKKSLALLLALVMAFSAFGSAIPVYAANDAQGGSLPSNFIVGKTLSSMLSKAAEILIGGLLFIFPNLDWDKVDEYVPNTEFKGSADFVDEPTAQTWKAGYASRSIIPNDISKGYPMAGFLNGAVAKSVYEGDGQFIRAVALDAGSGIVIFASIDGFGMTNATVQALRANLAEFAAQNNIVSINFTLSHTHYGIDTHGLGQDVKTLITSNLKNLVTRKSEFKNPVDETIYSLLLSQSKAAVTEAVESMEEGTLSYGSADISELIKDKQNPIAFDPNVNQIKFVPADAESNEIWLVNMGVHPTSLSREEDKASADYPGEIARYAKEVAGADVAFFQGAQAALTKDSSSLNLPEGSTGYDELTVYGREIVNRLLAIDNYTEIEPIMNIVHTEVLVPVTNPLLWVVCKFQMANNRCVMQSSRIQDALAVTEIGYAELGSSLAVLLLPGEFSAEIVWGGTKPASIAWNGTDWQYEPIANFTGGRKTIAFGLTNDQVGYVVPDNDYANTFADVFDKYYGENNKHYEEFLSLGKATASTLTEGYIDLLGSVR